MNNKVSVIIPCYKCKKTIKRCLDSVLNQSLKPYEVILIDDFSNDDTVSYIYSIIDNYSHFFKIIIIELKENKGPGHARNKGIDIAQGDYIAFLDSDDSWIKDKLLIQLKWMEDNRYSDVTATDVNIINDGCYDSIKEVKNNKIHFKELDKKIFSIKNKISSPSVIIKNNFKSRFKTKKYSEDFLFWGDLLMGENKRIFFLKVKLTNLHKKKFGDGGLSGNLLEMEKGELDTIKEFYKKGYFNLSCFLYSYYFSIIKFFIRFIKVKIRRFL